MKRHSISHLFDEGGRLAEVYDADEVDIKIDTEYVKADVHHAMIVANTAIKDAMQATIDNKDAVINIAAIEFAKKVNELEKLNKVIDECRDACRYTHTAEVVEGIINEHRSK